MSGGTTIRNVFLDPQRFPGKFIWNSFVGQATKRFRAFGFGAGETSEEIG
jgi:hypothetical protein